MQMRAAGDPDADSYLIDHTAAVFLLDPDGNYHAVFSPPLDADTIAGDFVKISRLYRH
jgi:cytochrome oxidase Cu insertion factor (SCO1/SenC/PrrC family)